MLGADQQQLEKEFHQLCNGLREYAASETDLALVSPVLPGNSLQG